MPELPEVETIILSLYPNVIGRKIESVEVLLPKVIKKPELSVFIKHVAGRSITGLKRRGKLLLFELDKYYVMVVHLRMTGRLIYTPPDVPREKHTHIIFYLDNGMELRYQDVRQFGTICMVPLEHLDTVPSLRSLGPDALDSTFTRDHFKKRIKGRRGQIKKILLDQTFVTGIGNIYADEILWQACIHPERPVDTLSARELGKLYVVMREILSRAVKYRGTTLKDYVDGNGHPGEYQNFLAVHGRENQLCPRCSSLIVRIKSAGRGTYFCPVCQK